jgi:excisionase family DNA binding protein
MSTETLTTHEAANRLGVTIRAVVKMIEFGRLEARRFGRAYMIESAALENITRSAAGRPPKTKCAKAPKQGGRQKAK